MPSIAVRPVVSIVIATHNRLARLQRCIARVRENVALPVEIIVVGASAPDGTAEWVQAQPDLRLIRETAREGATRAYNKGFRAATAEFVMWLNDDSYPLPGAVEAAVGMIRDPALSDLGMVAFYHNFDRRWNRLHSVEHAGETYSIFNVRGVPYANFGLLRRSLLESFGFLDERYYFSAWDPDLSLKVQREAGLIVLGCPRALIYHEELIDDRKQADLPALARDNELLFAKWNLPAKYSYADPAPEYQQMLVRRGICAIPSDLSIAQAPAIA